MTSILDCTGAAEDMPPLTPNWGDRIPPDQWEIYQRVIAEARAAKVRFALGGAAALAVYTGEWRDTKDLDLYIFPQDRHAMIEASRRAGLSDLYDQQAYDRAWIYRAGRGATIVDVIWAMANLRGYVDEIWLDKGRDLELHGEPLRAIPAEELIWAKLYVLQRDRCDWMDILNLLEAQAPQLDWDRLLARVGPDTRLLAGVLSVFAWLASPRACDIPPMVWTRLRLPLPDPASAPEVLRQRADLLDSRPWLGSLRRAPE